MRCDARKRLVVVGGWDPETWAPTDSVLVYDFLTGAWRRGAAMPGPRRSFFACAAVGGKVFVAGGHDEEKNALRSALAYDPDADAWAALPDMAEERDEPRGLCVDGKFLVVGGYPTPAQGRFVGSAEWFDPATSTWSAVQEGFVDDGACPRTCSAAPEAGDRMYMLRDGHLVARHGGRFRHPRRPRRGHRVRLPRRRPDGVHAAGGGRQARVVGARAGAARVLRARPGRLPSRNLKRITETKFRV